MLIKIENLSKTYNKKFQALQNVNLDFKKNKITGLIGFNGSGKTTTFNILTEFIESYKGKITFDGQPMDGKIKQKISFLSAGAENKNPTKVSSHFNQIASLYQISRKKAKDIILDISEKLEFTQFLNKPVKTLSKGNQQKIKVIAALLNPDLETLFLDEPFDGLDPIMVKRIKKIFMELKNVTIIITSHRMNVVQEMCDEFYVLKDGLLIDKKKTEDGTIFVSVNKEVPIADIKKIKFILGVQKKNNEIIIQLKSIKDFKDFNNSIISHSKFIWCSLKEKNIAESVFEGYGE